MSAKGAMVAAYAKDHSYYETLDFVCKLIGLDAGEFREEDHPRDENGRFTGNGSGASTPKTKAEIRDMIAGKYNYASMPDYKAKLELANEAREKYDALRSEYNSKMKEADKELTVDPDLGRNLSSLFKENYSEKGQQLLKEAEKMKPQIEQAENDEKYYRDALDRRKRIEHDKQVEKFHPEPLKPTDKTDFDGFKIEGDSSYLKDKLKSGEARVVEMSPKEYLERCAYEIFDGATIESTVNGTDPENVNKYADMMRNGTKFYVPYLDYKTSNQEGRHRAIAAMINGIEKIPVAIIGRPPARHAHDADSDKDEVWITTENGHHVKLDEGTGEIKAGFGGKHNGETLKEAFGGNESKTPKSSSSSANKTKEHRYEDLDVKTQKLHPKFISESNYFKEVISEEDGLKLRDEVDQFVQNGGEPEREQVDLDNLKTDQSTAYQPTLYHIVNYYPSIEKLENSSKEVINNTILKPITIVEKDGEYTCLDGNHRIIAAKIYGANSLEADVYHLPSYSSDVIKAATGASDYVDFWLNLPESEQSKLHSKAEIEDLFNEVRKDHPETAETPKYKPTVSTKADMPKTCKIPDKLPEIKLVDRPDKSFLANATHDGVIEINQAEMRRLGLTEISDETIAHEAAHQISNNDLELATAIIGNYGDVLGRFNQEQNHFEGIYGEYSPEEAFATGLSNYRNHPDDLKQKYPDAYEFFDNLAKNQPEIMDYLDKTVEIVTQAVNRSQSTISGRMKLNLQMFAKKKPSNARLYNRTYSPPSDKSGKPYRFKRIILPYPEFKHVTDQIREHHENGEFEGKEVAFIKAREDPNDPFKPHYIYKFEIHDLDEYNIYEKIPWDRGEWHEDW